MQKYPSAIANADAAKQNVQIICPVILGIQAYGGEIWKKLCGNYTIHYIVVCPVSFAMALVHSFVARGIVHTYGAALI